MIRRIATLLAVPLALAGCSGDLITGPEQQVLLRRLHGAEARWEAQGPHTYSFTLYKACFCAFNGPVRVQVLDDVVTEVRMIETDEVLPAEYWQWYPSVRELFAVLEDAITLPAGTVEMEFDAQLGFPTTSFIDWYPAMADDEVGYTLSGIAIPVTLARAP